MRGMAKLAYSLVGLSVTACLGLSGAALWYLHTVETRFKALTGCVLSARTAHFSVGLGAYRRELDTAVVRCPTGPGLGGAFIGLSQQAQLELAVWHPFSVKLTLQGGQKISTAQHPSVFLVQGDGAALQFFVPLWQKGARHTVTLWSAFQHVSLPNGQWAGQGGTVQQVRGKLVWNTQASAQDSAVGLALSAQNAAFSFWKESVVDVSFAAAIPGPFTAHRGFWQQGAPLPQEPRLFSTPDVVVQTLSGVWHGVRVGWSARLWVLPPADVEGESWVTLPGWPAVLDALRAEHTLTPPQQEALLKVQNMLAQQHRVPQGPFTLPLAVRGGQVRFGPCRMSVQQVSCPDFF